MGDIWQDIARRIVHGLGTRRGDLAQVRDNAGRIEVLSEVALAVELAGATPLVQLLAPECMQRLWDRAPRDYLARWDQHRSQWAEQTDRYVTLAGQDPPPGTASRAGFRAWTESVHRLTVLEEARPLPALLVPIPTEGRARQLGLSLEPLEAILCPALGASVGELQQEIGQVLAAVEGRRTITLRSGGDHELRLDCGDRPWLYDDGLIDETDIARGAIVGNLPAGSVYTTVLESETEGRL